MPFNWIPRLHHALVAVLLLAVAVLVAGSTRPVTASAYPATGSTVAREAQSITTGELPASAAAGPVVYLTFDDGPHPQWTPQILAVLARYQARATFFAIGQQAQRYPVLIASIASGGHTLGNHTFSHVYLRGITRERFANEVQRTQPLLGVAGRACLRPPAGAIDGAARGYAAELGYRVVMWDVDPRDWALRDPTPVAAHILQRVRPGSIVLLHDGGGPRAHTVAALDTILRQISARGYQFAPVCP